MFEKARLKLTGWYLLIIMTISILFSVAFYHAATREVRRVIRVREFREQNLRTRLSPSPRQILPLQDIQELEQRLQIILILINGGIFIVAGASAYFLAGKTLRPIREMVDEQNRFVTDASHELRTPLTALRTEIEVALRDKKLNLPDAKKLLLSNLEETIHLQALCDNLLEFTSSPNNASFFELVDLSEVLESAQKKMSPLAKRKKIGLMQKIATEPLLGDSRRLIQLFVILLDNAIKYSPQNTTVVVSSKRIGRFEHIEVRDEGKGIEKEDLPHIFERFYRSDKARSKKINGYGLGLAIAKKIVEEHKGTIQVRSEKNKGTSVYVELPLS